MQKNFSWNMTVVYKLPYTLSLGINPSVTVPNYEVIFQQVETKLNELTTYPQAQELCDRFRKMPGKI